MCAIDGLGQVNVCDEFACFKRVLNVWRVAGQLVKFGNWNGALALWAFDMDDRFECGHGHAHV